MNDQVVQGDIPLTEPAYIQGKAIANLVGNVFFWGLGVVVIILLAKWKRWLGIAGFAVYSVTAVLDVIQGSLVLFGSSVVIKDFKSRGASSVELNRVRRAILVRVIDDAVMVGYTLFLYYWLF